MFQNNLFSLKGEGEKYTRVLLKKTQKIGIRFLFLFIRTKETIDFRICFFRFLLLSLVKQGLHIQQGALTIVSTKRTLRSTLTTVGEVNLHVDDIEANHLSVAGHVVG